MARVVSDEIRALARLCRLELEEAEIERFSADLSRIVAHIETLAGIEVEGVEPFVGPEAPAAQLRADTPATPLARERALAPVPAHDEEFVLVPRFKDEM